MRALCFAIAIAVACAVPSAIHAADVGSKSIAARVEIHSVQSLTISDQQFLTGDAGGKPVAVTGDLRIAQGAGKLPVVVFLHGSGGMGPNIEVWSREFNAMGISRRLSAS